MADVVAHCPPDLSTFVFVERRVLTWHRVAEYQRVALKLIAEHVLQAGRDAQIYDELTTVSSMA